jgi:hypothetical protein
MMACMHHGLQAGLLVAGAQSAVLCVLASRISACTVAKSISGGEGGNAAHRCALAAGVPFGSASSS